MNKKIPIPATAIHDHLLWDQLVKKFVSITGFVDYKGFKMDEHQLTAYLHQLSENPASADWPNEQQLAYWINAYNAFTVLLIVQNYGVQSIKEIQQDGVSSPWKIPFFTIGGEEFTLDKIEHSILRKQFKEPRIHFAIVCGSFSCPKFRNEAYTGDRLEEQLQEQTRDFILDKTRNDTGSNPVQLSSIFKWYAEDFSSAFSDDRSLLQWINQYLEPKMDETSPIEFLPYNCALNGR